MKKNVLLMVFLMLISMMSVQAVTLTNGQHFDFSDRDILDLNVNRTPQYSGDLRFFVEDGDNFFEGKWYHNGTAFEIVNLIAVANSSSNCLNDKDSLQWGGSSGLGFGMNISQEGNYYCVNSTEGIYYRVQVFESNDGSNVSFWIRNDGVIPSCNANLDFSETYACHLTSDIAINSSEPYNYTGLSHANEIHIVENNVSLTNNGVGDYVGLWRGQIVAFTGVQNTYVSGLHIDNWGNTMGVNQESANIVFHSNNDNPTFNSNMIFEDIISEGAGDSAFKMVNYLEMTGLTLQDFYVLNSVSGIDLLGDGGVAKINNLVIDNLTCENIENGCFQANTLTTSYIQNSQFINSGWGVDILGDTTDSTIQNNHFENLSSGIYQVCSSHGTQCENMNINGNTFINISSYALLILDTYAETNINGNVIDVGRVYLKNSVVNFYDNNITNTILDSMSLVPILFNNVVNTNISNNLFSNNGNNANVSMKFLGVNDNLVFEHNIFDSPIGCGEQQKIIVSALNNSEFNDNDVDVVVEINGGTNIVFKENIFREEVRDTVPGTKFCDYATLSDNTYVDAGWYNGVNIGNCPVYSEFGVHSDFSAVSDWSNVPLELGNSHGLIDWIINPNLSGLQELNLNSVVEIGDKSIFVDSASMGALNVSANLTFENVVANNVGQITVLKDGTPCTIECSNIVLDIVADTLSVEVSEFSTYTVVVSGYVATFDADDTDEMVVDGIGIVLKVLISLAGLIGIVLVFRYFKRKK